MKSVRKPDWNQVDDVTPRIAFGIQTTAKYVYVTRYTIETGGYDITFRLPIAELDKFVALYDTDKLEDWFQRRDLDEGCYQKEYVGYK